MDHCFTHAVWPDFYIVGAPKAGTTSLWAQLRKHPGIFLPAMKEPHFFSDSLVPAPAGDADMHCPGDLERYQSLYPSSLAGSRVRGDASPSYLWDPSAARNIHRVRPDARIVVMLRDPVERAFSHYLMALYLQQESLSELAALERDHARPSAGKTWWNSPLYIELGLYYEQVKRYYDLFGPRQVAVYLFNDLQREPLPLLAAIARHIGVDPRKLDLSTAAQPENAYRKARFPVIHHFAKNIISRELRKKILPAPLSAWLTQNHLLYDTRKPVQDSRAKAFLQPFFEEDLQHLEGLLQRPLPELRRSWLPHQRLQVI